MVEVTFGSQGDGAFVGRAVWNQREWLAARTDRVRSLAAAVNDTNSLNLPQWGQLMAVTAEFRPDLIIELGRGSGNSTCAFAEAAEALHLDVRIVSLCRSLGWGRTRPRIAPLVDERWHARLDIRSLDITRAPFEEIIGDARRVLLFWDAHGLEIAEAVIGHVLPLLAGREHLVVMHDISDARYHRPDRTPYGTQPLWTGEVASTEKFRIGHLETSVTQAIAILDFCTRNDLPLHSADESLDGVIESAGRASEMTAKLGDLYSNRAHWFWFNLAEAARSPLSFPVVAPQDRSTSISSRVKRAILVLLGKA